jgi:hypothetical protein
MGKKRLTGHEDTLSTTRLKKALSLLDSVANMLFGVIPLVKNAALPASSVKPFAPPKPSLLRRKNALMARAEPPAMTST